MPSGRVVSAAGKLAVGLRVCVRDGTCKGGACGSSCGSGAFPPSVGAAGNGANGCGNGTDSCAC